jgi:hypothetical protein
VIPSTPESEVICLRILNNDADTALKSITLYLTLSELNELQDSLNSILNCPTFCNHEHIDDDEFTHEVTVTVYDEDHLHGFDHRSVQLIREDK